MTPQEQQLITELFARLKQMPAQVKDAKADELIGQGVTENPQAAYLLVQTVLIQDMALSQAQHRVSELEREVADKKSAPATSFLGGLLSGRTPPPTGPSASPSQATAPASPPAAPRAAQESFVGAAAPGMLPGASSGFLRGAAATALGVVGGQLLFQGIQSMFGPHAGSLFSGQSVQPALSETVVNNFYGDHAPAPQDASDDSTDADDDSGHDVSDASDQDFDTDSDDGFDGS